MVDLDNGSIRVSKYKKATVVEAYTNSEITGDDIDFVLATLSQHSQPPHLLIAVQLGDYSLTAQAQAKILVSDDSLVKIAFVVDEIKSMTRASRAKNTYLYSKNVVVANSIEEAYALLIAKSDD